MLREKTINFPAKFNTFNIPSKLSLKAWLFMGVSKDCGTPKWMVKIMEKPIKNGWFGGETHYFWKHPHKQWPYWLRKASFTSCLLMSSHVVVNLLVLHTASNLFDFGEVLTKADGNTAITSKHNLFKSLSKPLTDIIFGDYIYYILLLYIHLHSSIRNFYYVPCQLLHQFFIHILDWFCSLSGQQVN